MTKTQVLNLANSMWNKLMAESDHPILTMQDVMDHAVPIGSREDRYEAEVAVPQYYVKRFLEELVDDGKILYPGHGDIAFPTTVTRCRPVEDRVSCWI